MLPNVSYRFATWDFRLWIAECSYGNVFNLNIGSRQKAKGYHFSGAIKFWLITHVSSIAIATVTEQTLDIAQEHRDPKPLFQRLPVPSKNERRPVVGTAVSAFLIDHFELCGA